MKKIILLSLFCLTLSQGFRIPNTNAEILHPSEYLRQIKLGVIEATRVDIIDYFKEYLQHLEEKLKQELIKKDHSSPVASLDSLGIIVEKPVDNENLVLPYRLEGYIKKSAWDPNSGEWFMYTVLDEGYNRVGFQTPLQVNPSTDSNYQYQFLSDIGNDAHSSLRGEKGFILFEILKNNGEVSVKKMLPVNFK